MSTDCSPTRVVVVRPESDTKQALSDFISAIASWIVLTWLLMLMLGVAHIHVDAAIPALGWWDTVIIRIVLGYLLPDYSQVHKLWTAKR